MIDIAIASWFVNIRQSFYGLSLLKRFKDLTSDNVVWVQSDFYWRYRVLEDDTGRKARG